MQTETLVHLGKLNMMTSYFLMTKKTCKGVV